MVAYLDPVDISEPTLYVNQRAQNRFLAKVDTPICRDRFQTQLSEWGSVWQDGYIKKGTITYERRKQWACYFQRS